MAYCTECGKKLPDSAVFCPNCGQRCQATDDSSHSTYESSHEHAEDEAQQEPSANESYNEHPNDSQRSTILNSDIYKGGPGDSNKPDKKDSRAALIVISSVLFLLIVAVAAFFHDTEESPVYYGYWESSAIDTGDGIYSDYLGQNMQGFISIQIEENGVIRLVSKYNNGVMSGEWTESDDGIRAEINDDTIYFDYNEEDDILLLNDYSDCDIIFRRRNGSIKGTDDPDWVEKDNVALDGSSAPANVAGSGNVGDERYFISVIGAEQITNVDGKAAIRIFFDFTNNSENTISAFNALDYYAKQDGNKLSETYSWDDVDVYDNINRMVRPGVTIQCCYEITYNEDGGNVDFVLFGSEAGTDKGSVTATYVPGQLPGSPAPFVAKAVEKPQWSLTLPSEGTLENHYYVVVKKAELLDDFYGDAAVRIYYEFTNNSDEMVALGDILNPRAYQDGISLSTDYPTVNLESDENFYKVVNSGETTTASFVFLLRNENSPVEAEIASYITHEAVGQTYLISNNY